MLQNAKAAFNQGLDAHIFAASASEADTNLENNPVDVLLLGPQVRYMKVILKSVYHQKVSQQMSLACLITA